MIYPSYIGTTPTASSGGTFNIGTPSSDRTVIVVFTASNTTVTGGWNQANKATIAGIRAQLSIVAYGAKTKVCVAWAVVPTGTTATIVFDDPWASVDLSIYTVTGASGLMIYDTNFFSTSSGSSGSTTVNTPPQGVLLVGGKEVAGVGVPPFSSLSGFSTTDYNSGTSLLGSSLLNSGSASTATVSASAASATDFTIFATTFAALNVSTLPSVVQSTAINQEFGSITFGDAPTVGNLLVAYCFHFNNDTTSAGPGWSILEAQNGSTDGANILVKIAGIGESATQTPVKAGSGTGSQIMWEVANWGSYGSVEPYFGLDGQLPVKIDQASATSYSDTYSTYGANWTILGAVEVSLNAAPTSVTGVTALDAESHSSSGPRGVQGFHINAATASDYSWTANYASSAGNGAWCMLAIKPFDTAQSLGRVSTILVLGM